MGAHPRGLRLGRGGRRRPHAGRAWTRKRGAHEHALAARRQLAVEGAGGGPAPGSRRAVEADGASRRPAAGERLTLGYFAAAAIAGGFQVPSPGGRIEGGSVLGQYSRMTV